MIRAAVLCALVLVASCQQQEPEDDGSYHPEKYEAPYQDTNQLTQGYQQQAYRAQPEAYRPPPQPQPYEPHAYRAQGPYQSDPRNAAILSEERYLSNDGKFGASYSQEDGVEFKEESDPDGTRRGQYSYVDPSGQRRTVTYTAGKHGFQASGDHLPSAPVGAAPQQPQYQPAPQQQYQSPPQQQYQPAPQQQQYQPAPQPQYQPAPQPQYRPAPQQQYRPAPQQQSQQQFVQPAIQGGHPDVSGQTAGGYSISSTY